MMINKQMIISLVLFILTVDAYKINSLCTDYCNDCIASNLPKGINSKRWCKSTADHTSFTISVWKGYNGCGYSKDIDYVYNKCANECSTCQKIDSKCELITDSPSAEILCKPLPCTKRGEKGFGVCCAGLLRLDGMCIDSKQGDCTPCGHKIEPNKPCCNTSGINVNGTRKCVTGRECVYNRECSRGYCCGSDGKCQKAGRDKDTGQATCK